MVKTTFRDFVSRQRGGLGERAGDAIGMVTFARYADNISPPTLDHEALLGLLDQVDIVALPPEDGTAIGDALVRAIDMLGQAEGASKAIILLTDGSYNAGEVEPLVAAQLAAAYGIRIHAIGAGSRGTALMPVAARRRRHRLPALGGHDRRGDARADRGADRRQVFPRDRRGRAARDLCRDRPAREGAERRRAPAALRRPLSAA